MTIHAADKNMVIKNVIVEYRDRPLGSVSKLNTFSDGFKVLSTILRLYRDYRPLSFFGLLSLFLMLLSGLFFLPVLAEYIQTGLVPRFPTLIVCGFGATTALLSLFSGMILQTLVRKNRQDFEFHLMQAHWQYEHLLTNHLNGNAECDLP